MTETRIVECAEDGVEFEAKSSRAKYCSEKCRKAASRRPSKRGARESVPDRIASGPRLPMLYKQVMLELAELEAVDTSEGVMALALAIRVESPSETGSAAATMTRELSRLLEEIRRKAGVKADGIATIEAGAETKLRLVK